LKIILLLALPVSESILQSAVLFDLEYLLALAIAGLLAVRITRRAEKSRIPRASASA